MRSVALQQYWTLAAEYCMRVNLPLDSLQLCSTGIREAHVPHVGILTLHTPLVGNDNTVTLDQIGESRYYKSP